MMRSVLRSLQHAIRGLKTVFKTERTFRILTLAAVLVLMAACFKQLSETKWIILLFVIIMVMTLEIFNSAIERLVDMLAPKTHVFAKEIKDLSAAMVFLFSIFAIIIGFLIFC
jgi:undecaprenol kinase